MEEEAVPPELLNTLHKFNDCLTDVERVLQPALSTPRTELAEQLSALDLAKLDLVSVYAVNALYWMYLCARGEDPKEHSVKQELTRVQSHMTRAREVQDKLEQMPRIDQPAARRFVRNALWNQAHAKAQDATADTPQTATKRQLLAEAAPSSSPTAAKRSKKKKKKKTVSQS